MSYVLPNDLQLINEQTYSRNHIDGYIKDEILDNPEMNEKLEQGVTLLTEWVAGSYYDSKNERLNQIKDTDFNWLVLEIFIDVTYCQLPELFTSVSSKLSSRLKFDTRADSIKTLAEILAVLCQTDAFHIIKPSPESSLLIQSNIPVSGKLLKYVHNSKYLPPMVCAPRELKSNYQSGYLTHNDSLILGAGNHHNGDLCLDVLNAKNQVALKLDEEFLSNVEEEPTYEIDTVEKQQNWMKFKSDSYNFYRLMVRQGNEFYLTHKVDKRGRIYAQGYHITTQGSAFKKAMIELADEEVVDGVPA